MQVDVIEVATRVVDAAGPLNLVSVACNRLAPLGEVLSTNGARSSDIKRYGNRLPETVKTKVLPVPV